MLLYRYMYMGRSLGFACLFLLFSGVVLADEGSDAEVQYLLQFVADSGCTFTRNGSDHDSVDAADHLRLKYDKGRRYAGSAEDFIDRLASESSWTGKPYTVNCDGKVENSGAWLHRALEQYRGTDVSGIPQSE